MKKFLVIIIFLIPVIVIIAIQGTGAAIEAFAPAVNAESIEIRDSFNEDVKGGRVIVPRFFKDGSDGYVYIYIKVLPSVAYSDKIDYIVSDETGYDGECLLERAQDTKYKITAKKNGSVLMRIFSVTNDNAYTMLNIYVTSELITDVSVYTESQDNTMTKINEGEEIDYYPDLKLYAYASPAEAIGDNAARWQTNDEDIAEVDANGKICPRGVGRAKITAWLHDKTGNEHFTFVYVNVYKDIILCSDTINISKEFLDSLDEDEIKEYILDNFVLKNLEQEDEDEEITTQDITKVSQNSKKVVYRIKEKELVINYVDREDIVLKSNYLSDIYMENGGYTLITEFADISRTDTPNVEYMVSDNKVLEIKDNKIIPQKEGECVVYAVDKTTGKRTDNVYLNVKKRIYSFQLNLSNMDNIKGIKRQRVWGLYWLDANNNLVNTFALGCNDNSIHPFTTQLELLWQTNNSEYATINNLGEITFYPQSIGKEVTITAYYLVHGIATELVRSYTFLMSKQQDTVNVYSLEQFEKANSEGCGKRSVALQKDINIDQAREIKATNSIYGNGYLINFVFPDEDKRFDDALTVSNDNINKDVDELVFENFTIQCDDNFLDGKFKGEAFIISNLEVPCSIRYIISRFCYTALSVVKNKSVTTIEGCILGSAGFAAIYFAGNYIDNLADAGTMIVRNTVFKETGCASLVTTPSSLDTNISKNYVQNIKIEGFIDSYNWKKIDELHGVFNTIDPSSFGPLSNARETLNNIFANTLENLLEKEEYAQLVYIDNEGQKWVSMNMFALGLSEIVDPEAFDLTKTQELELMPLALPRGIAKTLKGLLNFDFDKPCYLLNYKFDETRGPIIKPNDVCPENEVLFNRLMSH